MGFIDSAWNRKTWLLCASFSVSSLVSKLNAVVPREVMNTLGMGEITMRDLQQGLPLVKADDVRTAIYLIVGHNVDGRWALYVGSSDNMRRRVRDHNCKIKLARRDTMNSESEGPPDRQYCHVVLAEEGWNVTYHALAIFDQAPYFVWKHMIETVFILLLGSMDKRSEGVYHNDACARLLDDMQHTVLKIVIPSPEGTGGSNATPASCLTFLGLNRCLPTKQGFQGVKPPNIMCDHCSTHSSDAWHLGDPGKSYEAYVCVNCYRRPTRSEGDQLRVEAMRRMLQSNPHKDRCDYCCSTVGTMTRNLATGMILCVSDVNYHQKHGELPPWIPLLQELPVLNECAQCGVTKGLLRDLPTRSVLCISCSDQYEGPAKPLIELATLKRLLPNVDECNNCGKTTSLNRHRPTQSVLCGYCSTYYKNNRKLPEDQWVKESLGATRSTLKQLIPEKSECSNCGSTSKLARHTRTQSVLCGPCSEYLRRNEELPNGQTLKQLIPELGSECSNCRTTNRKLTRHGVTLSVLCDLCIGHYRRHDKLPPPEQSLKSALPVLDRCSYCGSTQKLRRHGPTVSVLCSKHINYYNYHGHLPH